MPIIPFLLALIFTSASAHAAGRPWEFTDASRLSSRSMSCAATNAFVQTKGAVILYTDRTEFDRYVRSALFCYPEQVTEDAFVPTNNNPACHIGYTCLDPTLNRR